MTSSPPDPTPILRAQRWVLAVMALFPERRDPDGGFSAVVTRPSGSAQALDALAADGLLDADDVRRELVLLMAAARTSEPIYNLARASLVAARAHTAYLIPLEEAWSTAVECAHALQHHCRGWFSMAEACLTGLTTHQGEAVGRVAREAFYALHARPDSPWNLVPWKTELPRQLPPPEVIAERVHVGDTAALTAALAHARPGQTLVLAPNRYVGPFHVTTAGLTLAGGPEVFIVPAADAAPEPLIVISAPTALQGLVVRATPGATAVLAQTPFLAVDDGELEGGERGIVFSGGFLQVRDTQFTGQSVGLALVSGQVTTRAVEFWGCDTAIECGAASLRVEGGAAHECGRTFVCAETKSSLAGSAATSHAGSASRDAATSHAPSIRFRSFISNSGILDFRDDGKTTLVECRLDGGIRVGGGELVAERCQLSSTSSVDFAIATFRNCHFLGAAGDNLVLGESQFTTLSGGQLGGAEGADAANVRVTGGTLRLDGVGLGPSAGHNLVVAPPSRGQPINARVELVDVALSSAGHDAIVVRGGGGDVRLSARNVRVRGAGHAGIVAHRARLAFVGLDVADVGDAALCTTDCQVEVLGFGLRGARTGLRLVSSAVVARDVVATGVDGPLLDVRAGRVAIAASDILLTGVVGADATLAVARAHVPADGLRMEGSFGELDRCRLATGAIRLAAAKLHLRRCEAEADAVACDAESALLTDPAPSSGTGMSPLLVALKPEPFEAWGVHADSGKLLAVARHLAKRLGYFERLGLRETPQGLRIDGPLPVVARFAPQLSSLIASPSSLGLVLAELLEPT